MLRRNVGTVLVVTALVMLILIGLGIARTIGHLPELAMYVTEDLFGIVLAVFVLERVLARREERRWLGAKRWLHMILLESVDDLLRQVLPATVPDEETEGETTVYEVTGERVHFGEVAVYGLLRLLVSPDDKDLQSYVFWYARELEPLKYARQAKAALSEAREQIRDTFGSSARLMEADITTMLIGFEQSAMVAMRHLDSAAEMRKEKLADVSYRDSGTQRARDADYELAFACSIIVESVVDSAMKPKAWLEDQRHDREVRSLFRRLQAVGRAGVGSKKRT
jgi:hypothetical protein